MKILDFDYDKSPLKNFLSTRYAISTRIKVEKLFNYCKQNKKSFFIFSLGCLLKALNDVEELRKRIVKKKGVIYNKIDGVTPIMNKEKTIFVEMRVEAPDDNLFFWYDKVKSKQDYIFQNKGQVETYNTKPMERDEDNIANLSCIPWIDFDTMTNMVCAGNAIMPLITWGKVNEENKMSVSITVSHIFVFGIHLAKFFERAQYYFDNFDILK